MLTTPALLNTARSIVLAMTCVAATGAVAGTDLHALWDDRCADCHGHSGDFTRQFLRVDGERLLGRHHVDDLRDFMGHHYLRADAVDAVYAMLLAQAQTPPRFRQECSRCHDSGAGLVREAALLNSEGILVLRTGPTLRTFLQGHRRLQPEDVEFYVELLTRIARETGQP